MSDQSESSVEQQSNDSNPGTQSPSAGKHQKYWNVMEERRERFRGLLVNKDNLVYSKPKRTKVKYEIQGKTITIPATVRQTEVEGEPTLFFLKAIMPGTVDQVRAAMSSWEHRSKWDERMSSMDHEKLFYDTETKEKLVVSNNCLHPYLKGLISPRQFTTLTHGKFINPKQMEAVSQSIEYDAYPEKENHVVGWSSVCVRMTEVSPSQLMDKYGIPEVELDGQPLKWTKCECMTQIDIKGSVPKRIYKMAVPRALKETYEIAREYMMREMLDLEFVKL